MKNKRDKRETKNIGGRFRCNKCDTHMNISTQHREKIDRNPNNKKTLKILVFVSSYRWQLKSHVIASFIGNTNFEPIH